MDPHFTELELEAERWKVSWYLDSDTSVHAEMGQEQRYLGPQTYHISPERCSQLCSVFIYTMDGILMSLLPMGILRVMLPSFQASVLNLIVQDGQCSSRMSEPNKARGHLYRKVVQYEVSEPE